MVCSFSLWGVTITHLAPILKCTRDKCDLEVIHLHDLGSDTKSQAWDSLMRYCCHRKQSSPKVQVQGRETMLPILFLHTSMVPTQQVLLRRMSATGSSSGQMTYHWLILSACHLNTQQTHSLYTQGIVLGWQACTIVPKSLHLFFSRQHILIFKGVFGGETILYCGTVLHSEGKFTTPFLWGTTQLNSLPLIRSYPTHCPILASPQESREANAAEPFSHTVHPQKHSWVQKPLAIFYYINLIRLNIQFPSYNIHILRAQ